MKNTNKKKIFVITSIVIIITIIVIATIMIIKSKTKEKFELNEFEKIGVYNYLTDNYISHNVLQILAKKTVNETQEESKKVDFAIELYFKQNNVDKITQEQLKKFYYNTFGQELTINLESIQTYNEKYLYDIQEDTINKKANYQDEKSLDYKSKINNINKENELYIINIDLYNKEDFELEPNENNNKYKELEPNDNNKQYLEENIGTAVLKIKVNNGNYNIVDYQILRK